MVSKLRIIWKQTVEPIGEVVTSGIRGGLIERWKAENHPRKPDPQQLEEWDQCVRVGLGTFATLRLQYHGNDLRVRVQLIDHARNNMQVNLSHAWL